MTNNPDDKVRSFWRERAVSDAPNAARFHDEHTGFDQELLRSLFGKGSRILDLGAGTCDIANWLVTDLGAEVRAVEREAEFLSLAISHPALTTECADVRTYTPQGTFDGVLLFGVIGYLPDPEVRQTLYARIARVLSPNGLLLIKNQFGTESPVEVDTYSPALGSRYYTLYPKLDEETALLAPRFNVDALNIYPPELSPHSNTKFFHIKAHLKTNSAS